MRQLLFCSARFSALHLFSPVCLPPQHSLYEHVACACLSPPQLGEGDGGDGIDMEDSVLDSLPSSASVHSDFVVPASVALRGGPAPKAAVSAPAAPCGAASVASIPKSGLVMTDNIGRHASASTSSVFIFDGKVQASMPSSNMPPTGPVSLRSDFAPRTPHPPTSSLISPVSVRSFGYSPFLIASTTPSSRTSGEAPASSPLSTEQSPVRPLRSIFGGPGAKAASARDAAPRDARVMLQSPTKAAAGVTQSARAMTVLPEFTIPSSAWDGPPAAPSSLWPDAPPLVIPSPKVLSPKHATPSPKHASASPKHVMSSPTRSPTHANAGARATFAAFAP